MILDIRNNEPQKFRQTIPNFRLKQAVIKPMGQDLYRRLLIIIFTILLFDETAEFFVDSRTGEAGGL